MKYGLSDRSLQTISEILSRYGAIKKVVLYGSRAKGNYKKGSDIDMTLFTNDSFTHTDLLRIKNDFDESTLPYFVDISNYSSLKNNDLIEHINRVGKELFPLSCHY